MSLHEPQRVRDIHREISDAVRRCSPTGKASQRDMLREAVLRVYMLEQQAQDLLRHIVEIQDQLTVHEHRLRELL